MTSFFTWGRGAWISVGENRFWWTAAWKEAEKSLHQTSCLRGVERFHFFSPHWPNQRPFSHAASLGVRVTGPPVVPFLPRSIFLVHSIHSALCSASLTWRFHSHFIAVSFRFSGLFLSTIIVRIKFLENFLRYTSTGIFFSSSTEGYFHGIARVSDVGFRQPSRFLLISRQAQPLDTRRRRSRSHIAGSSAASAP